MGGDRPTSRSPRIARRPSYSLALGVITALLAFWLGRASSQSGTGIGERSVDLARRSQPSSAVAQVAVASVAVVTVLEADHVGVEALLARTHRSLQEQTTPWRWQVWTDAEEVYGRLGTIAQDEHVELHRGPPASGAPGLRNAALVHVQSDASISFIAFADAGDTFEITALEKSLWMLESVQNWAFVSSCACQITKSVC